ncbi:MAG: tetratricopeptide repeat protein [Candidatus Hydrogenedentes bacterium]|nr:tetratricopeptide repeat protein [Candidatus Hydrogenedentota bacterium]
MMIRLLCCAVTLWSVTSLADPDFEAIVIHNEPAVVVIVGQRSSNGNEVQSSGCCIDTRGYVLTTAHQIDGVGQLTGRLQGGLECALEVVEVDAGLEIALLKSDRPLPHAVPLGDALLLKSAAPLISIAAPRNLEFSTVTGVVSNTDRTYKGYPVIQADLNASPGSSGGPVFDGQGALVGLIIGKLREEDWITIVNPINNAFAVLDKYGLRSGAAPAQEEWELTPVAGLDERTLRALLAYNEGVTSQAPEKKAQHYQTAVQLLPAFFEGWFNLGVTYGRQGDLAQAEKAYGKARELRPDSIAVLRNLGRLYLRAGRLEDAERAFASARELDPGEAQSYNDLGEVLRRMKRVSEAETAFAEAIKLDGSYAPARYNLALLYAGNGNRQQAVAEFQKYLELAPGAPEAAQVQAWIVQLESGN